MPASRAVQIAVLAGGGVLAAGALASFAAASWRSPLTQGAGLAALGAGMGVAATRARSTPTAEALGALTTAVALTLAVGIRSVEPALAALAPAWLWGASAATVVAGVAAAWGRLVALRAPVLVGVATLPVAAAVVLDGLGLLAGWWAAVIAVWGACWRVAGPRPWRRAGGGAWAATSVAGAVLAAPGGVAGSWVGVTAGAIALAAARAEARHHPLVEVPTVVGAAVLAAAVASGHGVLWLLATSAAAGVAGRWRSSFVPSAVAVAVVAAPAALVATIAGALVSLSCIAVIAGAAGVPTILEALPGTTAVAGAHALRVVVLPWPPVAACMMATVALAASLRPRLAGPVAVALGIPLAWSVAAALGADVAGDLHRDAATAAPWVPLGLAGLAALAAAVWARGGVAGATVRAGGVAARAKEPTLGVAAGAGAPALGVAAGAAVAATVAACRLDLGLAAGPTGLVLTGCATLVALAQPRWRVGVLVAAGLGALVTLACPPLVWATAAFALTAGAAALVAAGEIAVASLTVAGLVVLSVRGAPSDARAALLGLGGVAATWLWMRRSPTVRSSALVPGLLVAALPALAAALGDRGLTRASTLAVAGAAAVAVGLLGRLRSPLVVGAAVVALTGLEQVGPALAGAPRWVPLALGAAGLLAAGAGYDQLRHRATCLHRVLQAMR